MSFVQDLMGWMLVVAFVVLSVSQLMAMARLVIGPDTGDRVLALDTMVINTIALLILYGLSIETEIFFEAAMIIAMLGFVSTVAYARFMLRGNIIE